MSRILLDTSAYSAALLNHPEVTQVIRESEIVYLNPILVGELLAGFRGGTHEQKNRIGLEKFIAQSRVEMLSIDVETAERYALIHDYLRRLGKKISSNDYWIAATAMQYSLTLLTLDRHFERIPHILTRCFNPLP